MNCLVTSLEETIAKNGKPFVKVSVITSEKKNSTLYVWNNIEDFVSKAKEFRVFDFDAKFDDQFPEVTSFKGLKDVPLENFVEFVYPNDEYAFKLLDKLISQITEPVLSDLVSEIFSDEDVKKRFALYPGAKGYHHAYKYGLLQHSYEVMLYVSSLCKSEYYGPKLNKQIALTGALLHDLGKIDEYSFDGLTNIDYARGLYIASHCSTGAEKVAVAFEKCKLKKEYSHEDIEKVEAVKHIIRAHHLQVEWQSVCKPVTLEAYLVFLADYFSAVYDKQQHVSFDPEKENIGLTDKREVFVKFW